MCYSSLRNINQNPFEGIIILHISKNILTKCEGRIQTFKQKLNTGILFGSYQIIEVVCTIYGEHYKFSWLE